MLMPPQATPGQDLADSEEGEGMGNNAMSFAVIGGSGGGGNRSIQAFQGQQWSITMQGCGVQKAEPIK